MHHPSPIKHFVPTVDIHDKDWMHDSVPNVVELSRALGLSGIFRIQDLLWWYSDSRFANLKRSDSESNQKTIVQAHMEIQAKLEEKPVEMTFTDE